MAIFDVEGSKFTKRLTGSDLVNWLVKHFNMPKDEAEEHEKTIQWTGQDFVVRKD